MGQEFLNNSMEAVKKISSEEMVNDFDAKFMLLKSMCDFKNIDYCIDKYIFTELDFQTPGMRGIGRINDDIPRFGGYFRKQLSKLPEEKIENLAILFKQSMYIGYLTHALLMEETIKTPVVTSEEALFKKWIPEIYISDIRKVPNLANFLYASANETMLAIETLMKKYGLKGGGFLSADKTDLILSFYPQAGFGLRFCE